MWLKTIQINNDYSRYNIGGFPLYLRKFGGHLWKNIENRTNSKLQPFNFHWIKEAACMQFLLKRNDFVNMIYNNKITNKQKASNYAPPKHVQ